MLKMLNQKLQFSHDDLNDKLKHMTKINEQMEFEGNKLRVRIDDQSDTMSDMTEHIDSQNKTIHQYSSLMRKCVFP